MNHIGGHSFVEPADTLVPHRLADTVERSGVVRMTILKSGPNHLKLAPVYVKCTDLIASEMAGLPST
jgi:hypothetical protein